MSDLLQKAGARQALVRHARLVEPSASPPTCNTADFAHATDATSFLLAFDDFPPELRGFVDALIGLAGSRTAWFSATDELIGERMNRSTRTVSRHREEFFAWQAAKGVTWVEAEDHYTDSAGQRHAHKYRVHLHRLAVETAEEARSSAQWFVNSGVAIKQAAINKRDAAPNMPARKQRGRKRDPDAETLIRKKLKTAATLLREAAKLIGAIELNSLMKGGESSSFQLDAGLVEGIRQGLDALSSNEEKESLDRDTGGRELPPLCPPINLPLNKSPVDKLSTRNRQSKSRTYRMTGRTADVPSTPAPRWARASSGYFSRTTEGASRGRSKWWMTSAPAFT